MGCAGYILLQRVTYSRLMEILQIHHLSTMGSMPRLLRAGSFDNVSEGERNEMGPRFLDQTCGDGGFDCR